MITLILIGTVLVNIDGVQVRACHYKDRGSELVLNHYVPAWAHCPRTLVLGGSFNA